MQTNKHIIYQTFPRLFGNYVENPVQNGSMEVNGCGKFNSYSMEALNGIRELGTTHVWFTGVITHATCTDYSAYGIPNDHPAIVKGKAGSPYAIKDYYDVNPDLAEDVATRMSEFQALVRRTHEAGMKVIIDFVPNHVSRTYCSLAKPAYVDDLGQRDRMDMAFAPDNNFYYLPGQRLMIHTEKRDEWLEYNEFPAKVTGNDCFTANPGCCDWYETVKLNYGVDYLEGGSCHFTPVPDTWNKMLHILLYWLEMDVDGFRCDMAEMVPVEFWNWVIPCIKSRRDVLFIAEIYNPSRYHDYIRTGHFDYVYDKVGVYDILRDIICRKTTPSRLKTHLHAVTPVIGNLLFFLENHDEQRIASDFFAGSAQAGIPALAFIATCHTNPVLIYNGQELGEKGMDNEGFSGSDGKTSIFDYWRMDSIRRWANNGRFDGALLSQEELSLRSFYQKILNLATNEKAFSTGCFYGLDGYNETNPHFPSDRMTAYLRQYEDELILVCINFDSQASPFRLRIPVEAFHELNIPDNTALTVTNLISGDQTVSALTHTCPYRGTVPPLSALLLKFNSINNNL